MNWAGTVGISTLLIGLITVDMSHSVDIYVNVIARQISSPVGFDIHAFLHVHQATPLDVATETHSVELSHAM
jgi:hypothetical protein